MKKFILGYASPNDELLTVYATKAEADFNSEEWIEVEAENIEEAKLKYEETFLNWQKSFKP